MKTQVRGSSFMVFFSSFFSILPAFIGLLGVYLVSFATPARAWEPAPEFKQIPIWPGKVPNARKYTGPEVDKTNPKSLIGGHTVTCVNRVTKPTITLYPAKGKNTGAAVVVFPGGGYQILAMDLEGTEVCDWLTAKG